MHSGVYQQADFASPCQVGLSPFQQLQAVSPSDGAPNAERNDKQSHLFYSYEQGEEYKEDNSQYIAFRLQDADAFLCHMGLLLQLRTLATIRVLDLLLCS